MITNWQSHVIPLDALVEGKQQPISVLFGANVPISIDLTADLDEGEVITNPVVTLWQLPAIDETDYVEYPDGLEGTPVVTGAIVSQVIQDLERGRVYRMELLFGDDNLRRGPSQLIACY